MSPTLLSAWLGGARSGMIGTTKLQEQNMAAISNITVKIMPEINPAELESATVEAIADRVEKIIQERVIARNLAAIQHEMTRRIR